MADIQPASRPAKPFQAHRLQRLAKYQAWVILAVLAIGLVVDNLWLNTQLNMSKNLLAGSVLAWIGQLIFAKISLQLSGYHQRRQIVHRFYLAHLTKWLVTLIGFIIIFTQLRPLLAGWVLLGFILLQFSYIMLIYQQNGR